MVHIIVREPRPGTAAKKPDMLRAGAAITVAGLAPEAGTALAVVRWTNHEEGTGSKSLDPSSMEVVALQGLPCAEEGKGPRREMDVHVETVRASIAAALPAPRPDAPVYLYTKDSAAGAGLQDDVAQERHVHVHEVLLQAVQGIPVTGSGRVAANVLSRSLGVNAHSALTAAMLDTARAVFPQAADQLRDVDRDAGLANALLVVAHVVGASIIKGDVGAEESGAESPRSGTAGGAQTPAGKAAATAAAATERPKRSRRSKGVEAGLPPAKRGQAAPAQAAAATPDAPPSSPPAAPPSTPGMTPAMLSMLMMHQQQQLQLLQQAQAVRAQQAQHKQQHGQQQGQLAAWPQPGAPPAGVLQPAAAAMLGGGLQPHWQGILPIINMSQVAQRQQQLAAGAQAPAVAASPLTAEQYLRCLQSPQYQQSYQGALAALNQHGQGQGQAPPTSPGSQGDARGMPAGGGPAAAAVAAAAAAAAAGPLSWAPSQPVPPDTCSAPVSPSSRAAAQPAQQQAQQMQQARQAQQATQQAQLHLPAGESPGGVASAATGDAEAEGQAHMPTNAADVAPVQGADLEP